MMILKTIKDAKKKKEKEKKIKAIKKIAVAASVGSALGGATGLLFAPKSGKETRQDIAKGVKDASESVRNSAANVKGKAVKVQKGIKDVLGNARSLFKKSKEEKVEEVVEVQAEKDE